MNSENKYFMGEYCDYEKAKIVVLPIPYERTTSYLQGTARGPEAIIEASYNVELYDIELADEPFLKGIYTLQPMIFPASEPIEASIEKIEITVGKILEDRKWPVILGGEHTISFPIFLAFQKRFANLSVLHLDAHTDLRNEYLSDPFSHACVMRRIRERNNNIVSVGIRSLCREEADYIKKEKPIIFFDHDIHKQGIPIDRILSELTDNVFITFDLDAISPQEMPSVGTPEPGGLSWFQVVQLFKNVFSKKNVVGADIVELKPDGINFYSDFWAAKIIYKMIGLKYS